MKGQQRRLAAIVCADVAGYSRLMGVDEEGTLAALKAHRRELVDPQIAEHGGRIVKTTGDGLLVEFPSVVQAVRCAIAVQSGMDDRNRGVPPDRRIAFRIGVNQGDVIFDDEDIFGDGVNIAARLQEIAAPGAVCVSHAVCANIRGKVPAVFDDGGVRALKNIAEPVRVFHWAPSSGGTAARSGFATAGLSRRVGWSIGVATAVMLAAIAWWMRGAPPETRATAPAARVTIAVLPFVNQSGDPAQEYFSDGVTDDLIAALGRFSSLFVMGRNSVFPYKGKHAKPAELGRDLGVRYLVEGSVRRAGERIRVSAQLTDSEAGKLLWSDQYDEELKDVFTVQDRLTRQIAGALAVNLTRIEQQRALAKPTERLDAYDLVLRSRERLHSGTRAGNREARQLLERAIQLDPTYAAAYAWLGRAYVEQSNHGWTDDHDRAIDRGLELARKAVALEPDNPEGHRLIGSVRALRGEYDLALVELDRVLVVNPSDVGALLSRADILLWQGRIAEAVEAGAVAHRFDPNPGPNAFFSFGLAYYQARRHADAIRILELCASRFPDYPFAHAVLAAAYAQLDRHGEAVREGEIVRRLNPFFDVAVFGSRFRNPADHAYLTEGLAKAGLK